MKRLIIAALLLTLAGCERIEAESTTTVGNGAQVSKLFTVDGCTVYRFVDDSHYRYFTNCHGTTTWQESCGNNCTRDVGVEGGAQ